jgi:hypothetical protein
MSVLRFLARRRATDGDTGLTLLGDKVGIDLGEDIAVLV